MVHVTGVEELVKFLEDKSNAAKKAAQEQSNEEARKELKNKTDRIVERWYSYYPPEYYDRKGNLDQYKIMYEGNDMYVDFSQDIADNQGNDYVLDLVVGEGYHGGSYGKDISGVRWRTGPHFCRWGKPAHMSPAIIDDVNIVVDELNKRNEARTMELFEKYFAAMW